MSDAEHMGMLRQRLKDSSPVLFACLERSWCIALDWWLHAVPVQLGSANSVPHLRNVERHLDEIIAAFEELPGTTYVDRLTPAEIYVLLSAVLFHDVGRTQLGEHGKKGDQLLHNRYAHFGIPSAELADVLGSICEFHNSSMETREEQLRKLSVTSIEPYGHIRIPFIASLLVLADCMDAGYTRSLPDFLVDDHDKRGIVGRFRRGIRGVYVDAGARMIRTVLADERTAEQGRGRGSMTTAGKFTVGAPGKWLSDWIAYKFNAVEMAGALKPWISQECFSDLLHDIRKEPVVKTNPRSGVWTYFDKRGEFIDNKQLWPILKKGPADIEKVLTILLTLGLVQLEQLKPPEAEDNKNPEGGPYPARGDLAIVIGDTYANRHVLGIIKNTLAAEGVVLSSWVIERDQRIYNALGELTYEPILTLEFLKRTIKGMWALSTAVFGTSSFSYRDLAAYIGEPDERRVEYAVHRIASTNTTPEKKDWVVARGGSWEWCVDRLSEDKAPCALTGVEELWKKVRQALHEPNEDFYQWYEWHKRMEEDSHAR